jgi:hypothetical protein
MNFTQISESFVPIISPEVNGFKKKIGIIIAVIYTVF